MSTSEMGVSESPARSFSNPEGLSDATQRTTRCASEKEKMKSSSRVHSDVKSTKYRWLRLPTQFPTQGQSLAKEEEEEKKKEQ